MEHLQTSEPVRFTPAQRDALLEMASRLQSEHEATIEAADIARAAAEAGIDPRFVREAAIRMEAGYVAPAPPSPMADLRNPALAMVGLAIVNLAFLFDHPRYTYGVSLNPLKIMLLMGAAFVCSTVVVRQRQLRWIAPLGVVALWVTLSIGFGLYLRMVHMYDLAWLPKAALTVGLLQAIASLISASLAAFHDQSRSVQSPVRF